MELIGAIDQGTSSTRFIAFDRAGRAVFSAQEEFEQVYPRPGEQWVEHDPEAIWASVVSTMAEVARQVEEAGARLAAVGVTNQRETTVMWDADTGEPLHNALVWLDTRTAGVCEAVVRDEGGGDADFLRGECGLPVNPYFSASKVRWLQDNAPRVREALDRGACMFGTVDSWLLYRLTGGRVHATDVTNASRTMLMDLATCQWNGRALRAFGVDPRLRLPRILSSSEEYGRVAADAGCAFAGVPVAGCLGDQQAAMLGQMCLRPGEVKNTYGTGCFMLMNTGDEPVRSRSGLLTTVCFRLGPEAPVRYALEGSVAIAGAAVKWMRDRAGLVAGAAEAERLASSVDGTGGVYFVTAFSGLFAPHWRTDARGLLSGVTLETTRAHIVRSALEAVCFRSREVIEAMRADSGRTVASLRADGGMSANNLVMQLQADLCGCEVVRPAMQETTALGAAVAAGLAVGVYASPEDAEAAVGQDATRFRPAMDDARRRRLVDGWDRAVERALAGTGGAGQVPPPPPPPPPHLRGPGWAAAAAAALVAAVAGVVLGRRLGRFA